jgi:hypothetical protein
MEPGFVLDRGHHSAPGEQRWVEGEPERSFWQGLKTKGREIYAVTTFRCERCGYLESYASHPAKV